MTDNDEKRFGLSGTPGVIPNQIMVSSVRVRTRGPHAELDVWNRGGHSGCLVVNARDGEAIAKLLVQEFTAEQIREMHEIVMELAELRPDPSRAAYEEIEARAFNLAKAAGWLGGPAE
jgi:hypothetical protein